MKGESLFCLVFCFLTTAASIGQSPKAQLRHALFDIYAFELPSTALLPQGVFNDQDSVPLHLLLSARVKRDLKISENQLNKLRAIRDSYPKPLDAFALLSLSANGPPKNSVNVARDIEAAQYDVRRKTDAAITKILKPDQLTRLKQIYFQEVVSSIFRTEIAKRVLDLGLEFPKSTGLQLLTVLTQDDAEIVDEIEVMRWKKYTEILERELGKAETQELLGDPLWVDVRGTVVKRNPRRSNAP